jgi:hypothetical protein
MKQRWLQIKSLHAVHYCKLNNGLMCFYLNVSPEWLSWLVERVVLLLRPSGVYRAWRWPDSRRAMVALCFPLSKPDTCRNSIGP